MTQADCLIHEQGMYALLQMLRIRFICTPGPSILMHVYVKSLMIALCASLSIMAHLRQNRIHQGFLGSIHKNQPGRTAATTLGEHFLSARLRYLMMSLMGDPALNGEK
ncbi:hypothetical protein ABBQ38_011914 [Trebouxia sp. C0009 RCD-2024]